MPSRLLSAKMLIAMPSRKSGFTLIETVVGSAVLLILFAAIASIFQTSISILGSTRVKKVAQLIAQEKIEIAHNISYPNLGTVGGIPPGILEQEEVITIDNQNFTVTTNVFFIDDPFDDIAPIDSTPTDYKRIKINVSWTGPFAGSGPVTMLTDIASDSIESDVGGGTLQITVFDANGNTVPNADVQIIASTITPPINLNTTTNGDGLVSIPGSPACSSCYEITVSKAGHTTDRTYGTDEVTNPTKPHGTILEGETTPISFAIDIPSQVNFKAVRNASFGYSPFAGVQMRVHGSKEIGRTALDVPIYAYDSFITTGFGGAITTSNLTWDTYTVEIPPGSSIDFAGSWPFSPFSLLPGTTGSFSMVVVAQSDPTLLVTLLDNTQSAIASASIMLRNDLLGYIATQSTNAIGLIDQSQSFFTGLPVTTSPFDLEIDAFGFELIQTQATISADTIESYTLTPQ